MPPAWVTDGAEAAGAWLIEVGIQLPAMNPESALLIRLDRTA
jgi:alpha-galactosidase